MWTVRDKIKIKNSSGRGFYLSQRIFSYVEKNLGISNIELILSLSVDMEELVLPLNRYINTIYSRIYSLIGRLEEHGYIISEKEIASRKQESLYSQIKELHRGLKITGKTPPTFTFKNTQIPLTNLNFDEMVNQSLLGLSIITPFLISPKTKSTLAKITCYKKCTIGTVFGALGYLHLLERKDNRYFLTSRPEKRQDLLALLNRCQINKEKYANRFRRCVAAVEMLEEGKKYKDIEIFTGYSAYSLIQFASKRPKLNSTRARILLSEGVIDKYEFEKLQSLGMLF